MVLLKDGSRLPGDLRLLFFGKTQAAFLDLSSRPGHSHPQSVVVQISEITAIWTT